MAKREADAASTSGNKKRRYVGGPAAARHDLQPGLRGVLLTCDVHAERDAIREAFRLFESLLDDNADATSGSEPIGDGAAKATAADALEAELAMLQQQGGSTSAASDQGKTDRPAAPFSIAQTGCNGNVFIRFSNAVPVDPVTLVDQQAKVGGPVARPLTLCAWCPFRRRFQRGLGGLARARILVTSAMKPSYAGSYAVAWRRRCNNDIDKMKCIDAIAAVVKKGAIDGRPSQRGVRRHRGGDQDDLLLGGAAAVARVLWLQLSHGLRYRSAGEGEGRIGQEEELT